MAAMRRWRGPQLPNGHVQRRQLIPRMFNRDQLAIGVGVELEHTRAPALAMEIAMAHLFEDAAYYARLEQMERAGRAARRGR